MPLPCVRSHSVPGRAQGHTTAAPDTHLAGATEHREGSTEHVEPSTSNHRHRGTSVHTHRDTGAHTCTKGHTVTCRHVPQTDTRSHRGSHAHTEIVTFGLQTPTWDVWMWLYPRMRVHPQGLVDTQPPCVHRQGTHVHTQIQRSPNLPSCTRRHKRDQDTLRSIWNMGPRAAVHTASSCPAPDLLSAGGFRR